MIYIVCGIRRHPQDLRVKFSWFGKHLETSRKKAIHDNSSLLFSMHEFNALYFEHYFVFLSQIIKK